jgi:hypothetical protein
MGAGEGFGNCDGLSQQRHTRSLPPMGWKSDTKKRGNRRLDRRGRVLGACSWLTRASNNELATSGYDLCGEAGGFARRGPSARVATAGKEK